MYYAKKMIKNKIALRSITTTQIEKYIIDIFIEQVGISYVKTVKLNKIYRI